MSALAALVIAVWVAIGYGLVFQKRDGPGRPGPRVGTANRGERSRPAPLAELGQASASTLR